MRGGLLVVWVLSAVSCAPPAPAPAPVVVDAGPLTSPSFEASAALVDVGGAPLRFRELARREGTVSIRVRDLETPVLVDVVATAPACLGPRCVTQTTLTLEPGVWLQVPLMLEIAFASVVSAAVTFTPREAGLAPVTVALVGLGTAAPGCLELSPSTIDFDTLNQGCPVLQRPLRVTNACPVPRQLEDAVVAPLTEPFTLSSLTSLPRRLAPGESWSGLAEFLGGVPGAHEALLRFQVEGELAGAIGLRGFRSDQGPREFSFVAYQPRVDLLVVLDSSPTFAARRGAVDRQVLADVTDLRWYSGPLRVGVIGTGGVALTPGRGLSFFDNDQLDFAAGVDEALARTPSTGDEVERCLETAAQLPPGFWRTGTRRRAVCITDAPEQSPFPSTSIATLADAGIRWDVIGPPIDRGDGGCAVEDFDDGGHSFATTALGGSARSICESWRLPAPPPVPPVATRYELPVVPVFPIEVWVDGARVGEADWNWQLSTRTLELRTAPRMTLLIRESPSCPP
ncbi:MAG: hypothetical protein Q8L48_22310 [Archangium sp.]|nr:hypothetical protein [Archangium sp.]